MLLNNDMEYTNIGLQLSDVHRQDIVWIDGRRGYISLFLSGLDYTIFHEMYPIPGSCWRLS